VNQTSGADSSTKPGTDAEPLSDATAAISTASQTPRNDVPRTEPFPFATQKPADSHDTVVSTPDLGGETHRKSDTATPPDDAKNGERPTIDPPLAP